MLRGVHLQSHANGLSGQHPVGEVEIDSAIANGTGESGQAGADISGPSGRLVVFCSRSGARSSASGERRRTLHLVDLILGGALPFARIAERPAHLNDQILPWSLRPVSVPVKAA
jgi:hypothetical protein